VVKARQWEVYIQGSFVTRSNAIAQEEADPQISAARLLLGIAGTLAHTGNPNGQMGMEGGQSRLHQVT
jgi:hypothetical protein